MDAGGRAVPVVGGSDWAGGCSDASSVGADDVPCEVTQVAAVAGGMGVVARVGAVPVVGRSGEDGGCSGASLASADGSSCRVVAVVGCTRVDPAAVSVVGRSAGVGSGASLVGVSCGIAAVVGQMREDPGRDVPVVDRSNQVGGCDGPSPVGVDESPCGFVLVVAVVRGTGGMVESGGESLSKSITCASLAGEGGMAFVFAFFCLRTSFFWLSSPILCLEGRIPWIKEYK